MAGDDVGDQAFVAWVVFSGEDGGLGDGGVAGEGGFDFAEFDAEAADLDLVVGAAEVVEGPSGRRRTRSPVRYMRAPGAP